MPEDFDRANVGLRRLQVRIDEGLIHLSFADVPPDFGPIAEDLCKFFGPHGWTDAKVAARETVTIRANWKLVAENFMECYHCPPAHPELAAVMSYVRAYDSPRLAEERRQYTLRWEARARTLGHVTGQNQWNEGLCHSVSRIPIREGFLTQSQDGQPVAPLMGSFKEYDGGVTSIQFFPNNWYVANNDYGMLSRFTPISPEETEAEITWIVRGDAKEGADYELGRLTWLWKATMDQDREITENNQAGVNSRYFRPGPHSRDENLGPFHRWYLDMVAADSSGT
jgi:Rieske 2Fe-2S family protein